MRPIHVLPFLLPLAFAACGTGDAPAETPAEPLLAFDTTPLHLVSGADTVELRVELAVTGEQRQVGLMERSSLPEDAGMLFRYEEEQPDSAAFWMYRTRIPLDIAYLDSDGTIRAIVAMDPCTSHDPRWCPSYPAGVPFHSALEVNRGYFARKGIEVGDRVVPAAP